MNDAGSRQIAVMGSCYALGTFADNFYKQAAVLMAAAAGLSDVQGVATVLFSLPFVLFSAWAGWLSDRMSKRNIVIFAKGLELAAMLAGGLMLARADWTGILAVMFVMAAQSALFSPAINGSIPELFPADAVPRVNALIKLASTAAILAGMALAGIVLDLRPGGLWPALPAAWAGTDGAFYGRVASAVVLAAVSCTGILAALLLRATPAPGNSGAPFPLTGPLDSVRHALACRKDAPLFLVLVADAWFYGISVVTVITIANLTTGFGHSNTVAGCMAAVLMVGIALGSLLAGRHSPESWKRLLLPSGLGICALLFLCALTPLVPAAVRLGWLGACLLLCGLCGGVYLIPLESYIQVRPGRAEKGKIIAVSNFLSFMSMAVFGALFVPVGLLPPAIVFVVFGVLTLCFLFFFAAPAMRRLPERTLRDAAAGPFGLLIQALLALRYRVREEGLDALAAHAPAGSGQIRGAGRATGILFLPNHPALIDPVILYSRLTGLRPRPLADDRQMSGPLQRFAGRLARVVTIPDLGQEDGAPVPGFRQRAGRNGVGYGRRAGAAKVRKAVEILADTLARGENVILYPSGRVYRDGLERIGNNSAAARVLEAAPGARVVLVRMRGLWGSSFSHAYGERPVFSRALARGLVTLLGNGMFFAPRREVFLEFAESGETGQELGKTGGRLRFNEALEDFYNANGEERATLVPRFFWQRRGAPDRPPQNS